MSAKAQSAVDKIKSDRFFPRKLSSPQGIHRLFAAVPQCSFSTRYMPSDTKVLRDLLFRMWGDDGHPKQERLQQVVAERCGSGQNATFKQVRKQDFEARRSEWWCQLFNLYSL